MTGPSRTRSENTAPQRNRALDIFSRSAEGRDYKNGLYLRNGVYVPDRRIRHYFPQYFAFYPYYCPTYDAGVVYGSPYSFYYGVCPPYIYRQHTYYRPPTVVYIDVPVYEDNVYRGYGDDDYYLYRNGSQYDGNDAELNNAIDDIEDAFRNGDIEKLVPLADPNIRIAVYRRGQYDYSLSANDYLDMTRDALRTTDTVQFDIDRVRRRKEGVYVASGKHVYRNPDGDNRTVYVSFVLERIYGHWTITQVGTAPDRIE